MQAQVLGRLLPDGKTLASAGIDDIVQLLDVPSHRRIGTLAHGDYVSEVAFSRDGTMLASVGGGRSALLWNVATRRQVAKLTGHTDGVSSVAFSPDGKTVATGSIDKTVRLWDRQTCPSA